MSTPTVMPVLSRGAHRKPRKGACFMEFASYLAGETWSDHPHCTHPVLAGLAREVNDRVSDDVRQRLLPLIPDVVGLTPGDARSGAWISRYAALTALRTGSRARQGVAAVGLLHCERFLNALEGRPEARISWAGRRALDAAPQAHEWARHFVDRLGHNHADDFDKHAAPAILASSVETIVASPGGDEAAAQLLTETIAICRTWMQPTIEDDAGLSRPDWCPDHPSRGASVQESTGEATRATELARVPTNR